MPRAALVSIDGDLITIAVRHRPGDDDDLRAAYHAVERAKQAAMEAAEAGVTDTFLPRINLAEAVPEDALWRQLRVVSDPELPGVRAAFLLVATGAARRALERAGCDVRVDMPEPVGVVGPGGRR